MIKNKMLYNIKVAPSTNILYNIKIQLKLNSLKDLFKEAWKKHNFYNFAEKK